MCLGWIFASQLLDGLKGGCYGRLVISEFDPVLIQDGLMAINQVEEIAHGHYPRVMMLMVQTAYL
jgi:hypothetical protein